MLAKLGASVARVLWPPRCLACGAWAEDDDGFCAVCAGTLLPLEVACPRCALPIAAPAEACRLCRVRSPPFREARAVFVYGGALADAIVAFKHGSRVAPARTLGRALGPLLDWAVAIGVDVVAPVPLHPRRLRARGFNQTLELLRAARRARPRAAGVIPVRADLLRRQRDTPTLGHLPPQQRRLEVAGAFTVDPALVHGRRILVVDDVMTSGATLGECARTLAAAGAADVVVGALARAV